MTLLTEFHNAILQNNAALIASAIKLHPRLTPAQQFAVYSNGYRIRLVQAIRSDYPILLELLGTNEFDVLATSYIEQNPPENYNLDYYPHKFAGFVRKHCDDKFATELAILEGTIAEVFMLPDSEPLTGNSFNAISPENFGMTSIKLRTASRLLEFSYPVNDWLTLTRSDNNFQQLPKPTPIWLLLVRHNNEVQRHNLCEQEFTLLQNLTNGKNISEALEATLHKHAIYAELIINNLQNLFKNWIKNGIFDAN